MTAPGSTVDPYAFDADPRRTSASVAPGVFSIGGYLKAQRRLRGMSLDELETATRIPRRALARLESGAFDQQQDAFVRGFVRSVALAIGLDPGDTLVRMLTGEPAPGRRRSRLPLRWVAIGGGALALVALAVGSGLALAGRFQGSAANAVAPASGASTLFRRDYVRELADEVRAAPPGTFARSVPATAPPAMFVEPAPETLALDAIFARPGADHASPAAVSSPRR